MIPKAEPEALAGSGAKTCLPLRVVRLPLGPWMKYCGAVNQALRRGRHGHPTAWEVRGLLVILVSSALPPTLLVEASVVASDD